MAIETRSEFQSTYLHFICEGPFEFEEMKSVFSKAFEIAFEKNQSAILVDGMKLHGTPPNTFERFKLGEYVAQ